MNINPVARFTFWLLFLSLCAFAVLADEFRLGKPAVAGITVCLTKEEAVAILTAEKEKGKEAADKLFMASENCANLPVEFTPKRIVATVRTARGLGKVVEIIANEKTVYWLTYQSLGFKEV